MLHLICTIFFLTIPFHVFAQAQPVPVNGPSFRVAADAELMSHFVERGLSQSDKDPALQAAFWFNFGPQFRAGVGGTNVGYSGYDSRFLLKYNADIKIDFSERTDLTIAVSNHNYFKPEDRNGWVVGLHLRLFELWRIHYDSMTNWEGTRIAANYLSVNYAYPLTEVWSAPLQFGYTILKDAPGYSSYYDLRSGIHYKQNESMKYKAELTWNSNASQFPGRGGIYLILAAQLNY